MFDAIPWYQVRCDALGCTRILTTEDDQPLLIRSPNVDRIPAGAATDDDGTPWTIHYLSNIIMCPDHADSPLIPSVSSHTSTRCWIITDTPDHPPLGNNLVGHWPTREALLARQQELSRRGGGVPTGQPVLLDQPCHLLRCSECEVIFGADETPGDRHYQYQGEYDHDAFELGWRDTREGWWCPDCLLWTYGDDYYEREAD